jgi:hypothetical protein
MIRVSAGFDAEAWARLAVTAPMHDPRWLRVMCTRLPGEVLTVWYGDTLAFVGVLVSDPDAYESYNPYAILWRPEPVFELAGEDYRRQRLASAAADPAVTLPALVLVAPGYWGDPAGAAADDPAAVRDCLHGVLAWARSRGISSVSVLYTVRGTDTVAAAFRGVGGVSYPLTERWLMPVWWEDWDGYLSGLPPTRAREIRRELRRAAGAGVHPARIDPGHHRQRIVELRCALLARYGQAADRAAERRRLAGLLESFGDGVRSYAAVRDGQPVAVAVSIRQGAGMHVLYSGIDPAAGTVPFAHFLATFYAVVADVRAGEVREIDYGIGHGAGKALRGCRPVTMFGHTVGVDPRRNALLRLGGALLRGAPADEDHTAVPAEEHHVRT